MKQILAISAVLAISAGSVLAQSVDRSEIRTYAPEANVSVLSAVQVLELQQIIHSLDREGDIRSEVRNYLDGF